jgi:hypothetical protein
MIGVLGFVHSLAPFVAVVARLAVSYVAAAPLVLLWLRLLPDFPLVRFDVAERVIRSFLEQHQTLLRFRDGTKELVELALDRGLLSSSGVLDGKDHYERHA